MGARVTGIARVAPLQGSEFRIQDSGFKGPMRRVYEFRVEGSRDDG